MSLDGSLMLGFDRTKLIHLHKNKINSFALDNTSRQQLTFLLVT